jgi:hypothetical protein
MEQIVENAGCPGRSPTASRYQRLVVLARLLLCGCVSTGGYIKGQVLDADTREPIPEVYVAIRWDGVQPLFPADFRTICVHADLTRTNRDGKFSFMPWAKWDSAFPISDIDYHIVVYKPAYQEILYEKGFWIAGKAGSPYLLKRSEASEEEQLTYLRLIPPRLSCIEGGDSEGNVYPLFEAMYFEAKALSVSAEEKEQLQWFRKVAASAAIASKKSVHMGGSEYDALINEEKNKGQIPKNKGQIPVFSYIDNR